MKRPYEAPALRAIAGTFTEDQMEKYVQRQKEIAAETKRLERRQRELEFDHIRKHIPVYALGMLLATTYEEGCDTIDGGAYENAIALVKMQLFEQHPGAQKHFRPTQRGAQFVRWMARRHHG